MSPHSHVVMNDKLLHDLWNWTVPYLQVMWCGQVCVWP